MNFNFENLRFLDKFDNPLEECFLISQWIKRFYDKFHMMEEMCQDVESRSIFSPHFLGVSFYLDIIMINEKLANLSKLFR